MLALAAADHDGSIAVVNGSRFIVSGTSVAAPEFAGLMALVIEKRQGASQGNANSSLYSMASGSQTPFHATLSGNNSVPGVNGFIASGATYNLATGLGSVDGAILVNTWGAETARPIIAPHPIRCFRFGNSCRPPLRRPFPARSIFDVR